MKAKPFRDMVGFPRGNTWLLVGPARSCLSRTLVLVKLEEACAAMFSAAELKLEWDVAPDVSELAIVGAVVTEAAQVAMLLERLHEVTLEQSGVRIFQKPNLGLHVADDAEGCAHDVVSRVKVACGSSLCRAVLCARRAGPNNGEEAGRR